MHNISLKKNRILVESYNTKDKKNCHVYRKNALVYTAFPLLTALKKIQYIEKCKNIDCFQKQIIYDIQIYENKALNYQCSRQNIILGRYSLCTALDEAIMKTPWGSESHWSNYSLLSQFHNETWGGERFFLLLEKAVEQPEEHKDYIELAYLILHMGFQGRYYDQDEKCLIKIKQNLQGLISLSNSEKLKKKFNHSFQSQISHENLNGLFFENKVKCSFFLLLLLYLVIINLLTWTHSENIFSGINKLIEKIK